MNVLKPKKLSFFQRLRWNKMQKKEAKRKKEVQELADAIRAMSSYGYIKFGS